ncbi:amphi-Trp domain-containing protein [Natronococcus wangiae]|uniref:amphi-Trp domain-containing protein n=1 Tax=Natronococcus wangiae TaxID=3068275 RepID=UPI00273F3809|nr:amphi-Trp domain-containing protein [Natronococcus sp. AD5]
MCSNVEFPDDETSERKVITDGFFEREVQLSRTKAASFLREIADALENDSSLTVSGSTWEIPFEYREPIEIEVEFGGQRTKELEIELEFEQTQDGNSLSVE